jgi:CBS domain-containing protein/gamma-glutamyl:cysteine ligase YbdK (ATP-grasp superfamily)
MGEHDITPQADPARQRRFTQALLQDVRVLERMLDAGRLESGVSRIGAEQEVFLVDASGQAAPVASEVLARLGDAHYTTELARFNLEMNLDPVRLGPGSLDALRSQLEGLLDRAREAAALSGAQLALTGILPTLRRSDLGLGNLSPEPRYCALDEAVRTLRGSGHEMRIRGPDELILKHDSVMFEACNTSFQVHLQVDPHDFARAYNAAQLVAAPVLAAATGSPLLLGRRLWRETRIALFQQSVDTRASGYHLQERSPRVTFGRAWLREGALEIFREDAVRFRVLLSREPDEDSAAVFEQGGVPRLRALGLHNGTVWRWNRPCYGVQDGKAHLRIENRTLPSGPSVLDELANAALWIGLVLGVSADMPELHSRFDFDEARANFVAAARLGLAAQLAWPGGRSVPAGELLLELLPLAREGLRSRALPSAEIERYLGIVEERVRTGRTASEWLLGSFSALRGQGTPWERLCSLTLGAIAREKEGRPVHEWTPARLAEAGGSRQYERVEQFMTTDLFTVHPDEVVDLAASLMEWKRIRHVPVEDTDGRLVGLVTYHHILHLVARRPGEPALTVRDIMISDPVTVTPETGTLEAIERMRLAATTCLPVVQDGRLVGIVTEHDFTLVAKKLLEEWRGR